MQHCKTLSTADRQPIRVSCSHDLITFELQDGQRLRQYMGRYSYESLPMEFKVIFENVQEIYFFVSDEASSKVKVENRGMVLLVNIIGKIREFHLPLDEVEPTGEMRLRRDLRELQARLAEREREVAQLQDTLREREGELEETKMVYANVTSTLREKESQNLKLSNRIRHLENSIDDLKSSDPNLQQRLTEEYSPVKKSNLKSKKIKELEQFGKKIIFKVDQSSRYYSKFHINHNEVEKLHGPTFQLYHNEAIPRQGRFYFDVKILFIRNNNFVVGVITDKCKDEQFSFKKNNCVCYNGYDGSICEQDRQSYVDYKPKEGIKIRTVVDVSQSSVEWYFIGPDFPKTFIGKTTIPPSMAKQPLYPYFELYWEANKIRLNA